MNVENGLVELSTNDLKDVIDSGCDSDVSTVEFNAIDSMEIYLDNKNYDNDTIAEDKVSCSEHKDYGDHNNAFILDKTSIPSNMIESGKHSKAGVNKRVLESTHNPPAKRLKIEIEGEDGDDINCEVLKDRKLWFECVSGNHDKVKQSITLESSSQKLPTVWVGVTGCHSPIKTYICQKSSSNVFASYYLDIPTFKRLHNSFIRFNSEGEYFEPDNIDSKNPPTTKLVVVKSSDKDQPLLVLQHKASMGKVVKETVFDHHMVQQYISKCWQLQRFICYLEKRDNILKYGESIILHGGRTGYLNKKLFQELFTNSNPPNYVLTSNEVWNYLKKKYSL